jgi:hypothetical protein
MEALIEEQQREKAKWEEEEQKLANEKEKVGVIRKPGMTGISNYRPLKK